MKLFIADIDGTLYWYDHRNNSGCSQSCRKAIQKWQEAGNLFAVATARVHTVRDEVMADLGMNLDYLGGNGAEIVYRNGEELLHSLPFFYFLEVGSWLDEQNLDATVKICVNHQFYFYRNDQYPFTFEPRMRKNLRNSVSYLELHFDENSTGVNMSILCHPDLTQRIEKDLRIRFSNRCQVLATDKDNIDFIPIGVGKGQAILDLAKHYHLSMNDVIVIGDAVNDLCMFNITENSYCMSHSDKEIQSHATHVVDLVEDAIYIELEKEEKASIV